MTMARGPLTRYHARARRRRRARSCGSRRSSRRSDEARDPRGAGAVARRRRPAARGSRSCILQTYLFAGFPRALNAAREWRRASRHARRRPTRATDVRTPTTGATRGERTCAAVYGAIYERLRVNIRELHPALDAWMIVEGYGKVLSRPGLDLRAASCASSRRARSLGQDRQLHSHLHGALQRRRVAPRSRDAVDAMLADRRRRVRPHGRCSRGCGQVASERSALVRPCARCRRRSCADAIDRHCDVHRSRRR